MVNQKSLDVYSLIGSQEIQEYYRKNVPLSVEQQVSIITHCYRPMEEQLECLKMLADGLTGESRRYTEGFVSMHERMLTLFYHPEKLYPTGKFVYSVMREVPKSSSTKITDIHGVLDTYAAEMDYLSNASEVMEFVKQCNRDNGIFAVDMLVITEENGLKQPASFRIGSVDGEYALFRCSLFAWEHSEPVRSIIEQYEYDHAWIRHVDIPFEYGSKVKIKLPFMSEPLYGVLWRELDGNQCWYNFFYSEGTSEEEMHSESFLDMSYIDIGVCSDYSVLDWLERAE